MPALWPHIQAAGWDLRGACQESGGRAEPAPAAPRGAHQPGAGCGVYTFLSLGVSGNESISWVVLVGVEFQKYTHTQSRVFWEGVLGGQFMVFFFRLFMFLN